MIKKYIDVQYLYSGQHVGVKKMHQILQGSYFWRYSYKSVVEYIQNCPICKSNVVSSIQPSQEYQRPVTPWSLVELHLIGPFESSESGNHFLLVLFDPVSHWVAASSVQSELTSEISMFLLENMCNFGVVRCLTYGLDPDQLFVLTEM